MAGSSDVPVVMVYYIGSFYWCVWVVYPDRWVSHTTQGVCFSAALVSFSGAVSVVISPFGHLRYLSTSHGKASA